MSEIAKGLCQCGCGRPTNVATKNDARYGQVKGQPRRFSRGHGRVFPHRYEHRGYVMVWMPEHPRAHKGYVFEHVLVAEHAVGHALPSRAEVHHHNQIRNDNRGCNLVILQNVTEHASTHQRRRVQLAGGDPWTQLLCCRCHLPKNKTEFYIMRRGGYSGDSKECSRAATRRRKQEMRAA